MKRDPRGDEVYWSKWVSHMASISEHWERLKTPSKNPSYRPQYVRDLAMSYLHAMLFRYSRGDSREEISELFAPMLDAWELSEELGKEVWGKAESELRHAWILICMSTWIASGALR